MTGLDHHLLNEELEGHDEPESRIVEKGGEDVDFTGVNDSAVDLVEQVHEDEGVEADGVEDQSIGGLAKRVSHGIGDDVEALVEEDEGAEVHQEDHDNDLVEGLHDNLSPDLGKDDLVSSANSVGLLLILFVWFSADGDSSEDIHDQVGPKHLNYIKWSVSDCHTTKDGNEADNDVDGKLELDELSNVVEDGSSPFHRSVDRDKVVVQNNEVGIILGYITA